MSSTLVGGLSGIVFDAYGTLFDLTGIELACIAVTETPVELAALWRAKQLEYALLRTAIDRYADWGQITSDALDFAMTAQGLQIEPHQRRDLLRAWQRLDVYPDVPDALARLHAAGQRMAILSNGSRRMLQPLIERNGLREFFIDVLSSDHVQAYKPDASIYALGPDRFYARIYELLFVSANGFDVAGSKAFGYTVCRVDRRGTPMDVLGVEPDMTVSDLGELAHRLLDVRPA